MIANPRYLTLLIVLFLLGCSESSTETMETADMYAAFRFTSLDNDVLILRREFSDFNGGIPNVVDASSLATPTRLDFDTLFVSFMDTVATFSNKLIDRLNTYSVEFGRATRLNRGPDPRRWPQFFSKAIGDELFAIVAQRVNSMGEPFPLQLEVYSVRGDSTPLGVLALTRPGIIALNGTALYLQEGDALSVIDLSDPSTPVRSKSLPMSAIMYMSVSADLLVITGDRGVEQFDISNPLDPVKLSAIQ